MQKLSEAAKFFGVSPSTLLAATIVLAGLSTAILFFVFIAPIVEPEKVKEKFDPKNLVKTLTDPITNTVNKIVDNEKVQTQNPFEAPLPPIPTFPTQEQEPIVVPVVPESTGPIGGGGGTNGNPQEGNNGNENQNNESAPPFCGDNIIQQELGEQCDDGNQANGDGCDSNCFLEVCGNNIVQIGEQCDDGNTTQGDTCSGTCEVESITFESPVKLYGIIYRSSPNTSISDAEMQVLATKYDFLAGLDGGSYGFPGAIDKFRELNTQTKVLCVNQTMDIQMVSIGSENRFSQLDKEEDAFFHSADPASLRTIKVSDQVKIVFKQDARNRQLGDYYTPIGVQHYVVEFANSKEGPYVQLGDPIIEDGSLFYTVFDPVFDPTKWYRVKSKLSSEELVSYSWPAQAEQQETIITTIAMLDPFGPQRGIFVVHCFGQACPQNPSDLVLEMDLDNDRIFEGGNESRPASSILEAEDGITFTGFAPQALTQSHFSYRAKINNTNIIGPPNDESYTYVGYNNRLQDRFNAHIIKPNHPKWIQLQAERLQNCMQEGYDGTRLDFGYDTVEAFHISNAKVSLSEQQEHQNLPQSVKILYSTLKELVSGSMIVFNGYFVPQNHDNYWNYLTEVDGADFEFFAFGYDPQSTELALNTEDAIGGFFGNHLLDKYAFALVGAAVENIPARMKSLELYLLLLNEKSYYNFYTPSELNQDIPYFPEWDVPLGDPLINPLNNLNDLVIPNTNQLGRKREFQNGAVFFNFGSTDLHVDLGGTNYLLSVTGGYSPLLGGNGQVHYNEVSNLTIGPKDGAIIVYSQP